MSSPSSSSHKVVIVAAFAAGSAATAVALLAFPTLLVAWRRKRRREEETPSARAGSAVCPSYRAGEFGVGTHSTKRGPVRIRPAEARDASTVLRLIRALAAYEREPASTVEVTEADLRRDGFGASPRFFCLIAELGDGDGDGAAGFALCYPSYSTWQGPCVYLEDLFVDERFRGLGLGRLLLKSVAALALTQGCRRLHWQALDWNAPALDFYDACGATRLKEWINLRMGRPQLAAFLGVGGVATD